MISANIQPLLRSSFGEGRFWKSLVVVVAVTLAVDVATVAGLAVSSYINKIDTGMTIKDVTDFLDEG